VEKTIKSEPYDLYCSPNIIWMKNEMDRVCSKYEGEEQCVHGFGGKI
jgi:hypothetical protein